MTFTDQFIEYAEEVTDCPRLLLEWAAIVALSSVMGRKIIYEYGDGGLYANIWTILIGPSSMHKSTAISLASGLMRSVNQDIFYPQGWSKEALWQEMMSRSHGLFNYDEAKSFFDCCSANYNIGIMNDITTLFGGGTLRRVTKKETVEIKDPYIGFIGASTTEWLIDGIKDKHSAILSGFLPRFLLINAAPSKKHYAWYRPVDQIKKKALVDRLYSYAALQGTISYDAQAIEAFETWDATMYQRILTLEKHALPYVPFLNKMTTLYPHKLAMIAALNLDTFPTITLEAWQQAESWLSTVEGSLKGLLGSLVQTPWDKMRQKAIKYISEELDCTREQFGDATRITGKQADMILQGLQNDGKIIMKSMTKNTKPVTVIQWVGTASLNGDSYEN